MPVVKGNVSLSVLTQLGDRKSIWPEIDLFLPLIPKGTFWNKWKKKIKGRGTC